MKRSIGMLDWITWGIAVAVMVAAGWTLRGALRDDRREVDHPLESTVAVLPGAEGVVVQIGRNPRLLPLERLSPKRIRAWWSKQQAGTLLLRVDPRVSMGDLAAVQQRIDGALATSVGIEWAVMSVREDRSESN